MDIEEIFHLKERNQRHIFLTALLMMTALVIAAFLFYRLQGRHAEKIQEMKRRLAQAERLSSLGRLAAGVAHEIRNPLNAVSMAIQRISWEFAPEDSIRKDEFMNIIGVVREEIRRLNRIIEEFISPSRERRPDFKEGRITDVLNRVLMLVREIAESREIEIESHWDVPEAVVMMDASMMHQALLNLLKNAVESIKGTGKVTVSCSSSGPRHLVVMIKDTGAGIDEENTERIFDFEYTTKEKGLGLGLPIAREIIQAHGGKIEIESEPGKGTVFKVVLPLR
jgi:signal transduction histidine kinase